MADPSTTAETVRVGVISDTHGELPRGVERAFEGVVAIVHAGDVGGGHVLDTLRAIAEVHAVRGNMDHTGEASLLPEAVNVRLGGVRFLAGHKKKELLASVDPAAAGVRVVVTGHTHRAHVEEDDGVLYLNPGSAGDPREGDRATVAVVEIGDGRARATIVGV